MRQLCPVLWKNKQFNRVVACTGIFSEILVYFLICKFFIFEWFSTSSPNYHFLRYPLYLNKAGFSFLVPYTIVLIMSLVSCLRGMFTDPGRISKLEPPEDTNLELFECGLCNEWKPPRAHHCSICGHCIIKMDHHCPWINNCVGAYNHKYFFLYLMYTGLLCIMTLTFSGIALFYYLMRKNEILKTHDPSFRVIGLVITIIELAAAAIFGLLILDPFLNVIYNGIENQTTVEAEKDMYGPELEIPESFRNIMGNDSALLWLFPITPTLHLNYLEMLYKPEDPIRKQPKKQEKYYPRPEMKRGKYEVAMWILSAAIIICFFAQIYIN